MLSGHKSSVFVEYRTYSGLPSFTQQRIQQLATLLHHPKTADFNIPLCHCYFHEPSSRRFGFVFEVPGEKTTQLTPRSLYEQLHGDGSLQRRNTRHKVSLTDRFALAYTLARTVWRLHLVGWVHQSLRSEHVYFFVAKDATKKADGNPIGSKPEKEGDLDLTKSSLLGFGLSRFESDFSNPQQNADECMERNIYRHPDRQFTPKVPFAKIHDVYSLGVILLEIGLGERAIKLEKDGFAKATDSMAIQSQLLRHAALRLPDKMGDCYSDIVHSCLTGDFISSAAEPNVSDELKCFRENIVDRLEKTWRHL